MKVCNRGIRGNSWRLLNYYFDSIVVVPPTRGILSYDTRTVNGSLSKRPRDVTDLAKNTFMDVPICGVGIVQISFLPRYNVENMLRT